MTYSVLGIDLSKQKFNAALILESGKFRHKVLHNSQAGFAQPLAWLVKHKVASVRACLEATGTYAEPLALFLLEAECVVSVARPGEDQGLRPKSPLPHQDQRGRCHAHRAVLSGASARGLAAALLLLRL